MLILDEYNVSCYISEPMFQLPFDGSSDKVNVLILVHPLLFFGVWMCRFSFLFLTWMCSYIGTYGFSVISFDEVFFFVFVKF